MATFKEPNKKYVVLENILIDINSIAISLQNDEIKRNNVILSKVIDLLITKMKERDSLFQGLYREKFYGGSFYDNLKVGNPNEYDLDLILNLPDIINPKVQCSSQPGFVEVKVYQYSRILEKTEAEKNKFQKLNSLLNSQNFLSTENVLKWMEGVMNKALNDLPKNSEGTYVDISGDMRIYIKLTKGAPAFTLHLSGRKLDDNNSNIELDIDFVACFQFHGDNWPAECEGYRANPSISKSRFFVVPKKPKETTITYSSPLEQYWCLSFQEQEREIISGENKKMLKPSLKLMKKLRDKHNHNIASYFIKTIYLWTVEKKPESFWCQPLAMVFMEMLRTYEEYLRNKKIPYYWNSRYNLIEYLKDTTKIGIANTLSRIINDVDKNLVEPLIDPYVIGKYLLSEELYDNLKRMKLSKKQEKHLQVATTVISQDKTSSSSSVSASCVEPPLFGQRRIYSELVSQINEVRNEAFSSNDRIFDFLKKMDEKLDRISMQMIMHSNTASQVHSLEKRVRQLELENSYLKKKIDEADEIASSNSLKMLVDDKQTENTGRCYDNSILLN